MDYLDYAYLQTDRIAEARNLTQDLPVPQRGEAALYAGRYAFATIPVRYLMERQQWQGAAALPLPSQELVQGKCDSTQANLYFARALGSSRLGNIKAARAAMQPIAALREACARAHDQDDVDQLDVQQKVVSAWVAWAEGDHDAALRTMKEAEAPDSRRGNEAHRSMLVCGGAGVLAIESPRIPAECGIPIRTCDTRRRPCR